MSNGSGLALAALLELKAVFTHDEYGYKATWAEGGDPCAFTGVTCRGADVVGLELEALYDVRPWVPPPATPAERVARDAAKREAAKRPWEAVTADLYVEWPEGWDYQSPDVALARLPCSPAFLALGASSLRSLLLDYVRVEDHELPACWAAMRAVTVLGLAGTLLRGTLPPSWGGLPALRELDLSDNPGIRGPLPPEWASLSTLTRLDLSLSLVTGREERGPPGGSRLGGTLPPAWSRLTSLQNLDLWHVALTGTLPPAWSSLAALTALTLSDTGVGGALPPGWSTLNSLQALHLSNTSVSGPLPRSWGTGMPQLMVLDLRGTLVEPPVPLEWRSFCLRNHTRVLLPWPSPRQGCLATLLGDHHDDPCSLCASLLARSSSAAQQGPGGWRAEAHVATRVACLGFLLGLLAFCLRAGYKRGRHMWQRQCMRRTAMEKQLL